MKIIERAVAFTIFMGSAGVIAVLMVLLIRYGLGIPLAVLRLNALISAGALCFVLAVGGVDKREK